MKVTFVLTLFCTLIIFSCQKENKKDELPLYSNRPVALTYVDSIITRKELPIKPTRYDTVSIPTGVRSKISYINIPLATNNIDYKSVIDTIPSSLESECEYFPAKPKIVTAKPFISYAQNPKPVKAGILRSTGVSNENIMYLNEEQGLPTSGVSDIEEDSKGFLWIAHNGGLTRYDGYNFYTYNAQSGLPTCLVYQIVFDKDSTMWLATSIGLVHFDGIKFEIYNKESGLLSNNVFEITFDLKNQLWLIYQFEGGLTKLLNGKLFHFDDDSHIHSPSVYHVGFDQNNNIVVGGWGDNPRYLIGEKTVKRFKNPQRFGSELTTCIFNDKNHQLWIGSYNGGAVNINDKTTIRYHPNTGFHYHLISAIYRDNNNNMWFGTGEGGLAKAEKKGYTIYTTKQGLSSNKITCITEDKQHNIWVGTEDGGLNRIKPNSFRTYTSIDGLSDKSISSLSENKKGEILIGTWADGIYVFNGERFLHIIDNNGLEYKIITSMMEDKNGNLFVGTHQHGYEVLIASKKDSVPYDSIYHLTWTKNFGNEMAFGTHITNEGDVWIANRNDQGLTKFNFNYFEKYYVKNGLVKNSLLSVKSDKKGNVWIINENCGISKIHDGKITHFTKANGLPSNYAYSIFIDHQDILWIGTMAGITRYDGKSFVTIDMKDGLSSNNVLSIVEDNKNRLWLGTAKGLNYLKEDKSKNKGYSIYNFQLQDGLKTNSFGRNSVLYDHKNNLWWGTTKGAIKLNLNEFDSNSESPSTYLAQISIMDDYINFAALKDSIAKDVKFYSNDSSFTFNDIEFDEIQPYFNYPLHLKLPYNFNHISFNFFALEGNSPHRIKFRYRLIGSEDKWSLTNLPEAKYSNLTPGSYSFEAQAKLEGLDWGKSFSYTFIITPPFWQTWWFRIIALSVIIYSIILLFRFRNRQLLNRQAILENTVKDRTQELVQQKTLIEEKQKEIVDSINYAERIQRALLASKKLLDENLTNYFILFKPKDVVSGDFYWASKLKNNHFALVTADSTGHGVPGAIMSIVNIASLKEAVIQGITSPELILNETRKLVIENLKNDGSEEGGKDGMDGNLLSFDFNKNILYCAGANNPIWIIRENKMIEVKADRMPIGKNDKDKTSFTLHTIQLEKGDVIYTFTDGYTDQFGGPKGKKFKHEQLKNILLSISNESMNNQNQKLNHAFDTWKGDLEQVDDVCLIGIRV